MRTVILACVFLAAAPALAQQPQTGTAAPAQPPSGVSTPAPVPAIPPPTNSTSPAAVPEQIAPPAGPAGPSNGTPFSNVPTGAGGNAASPLPNVSK